MADELQLPEEEAALYVFGGLSANERRKFEARLAQSQELRALVRDLEEGAVALASASPTKRAPQQVWERIEQAVAKESKRNDKAVPAFWLNWWRHGWTVAAACLVGWLLHVLWLPRPGPPAASMPNIAEFHTGKVAMSPDSSAGTMDVARRKSAQTNAAYQLVEARTREVGELRAQVAALGDRVMQLSQTLTQQQALLNESNRIKFVQLSPASGVSGIAPRLSPEAQRALFLAMARELGWLPTNMVSGTEGLMGTNDLKIDFVDLRSATNRVAPPPLRSQPDMQARTSFDTTESTVPPTAPANSIPAIVSSDHLVVAVDSTIAASGSQLTFAGTDGQEPLGIVTMGVNPMVVTVPFVTAYASVENGLSLTVTSGTAGGVSNIFQFSAPGLVPP